MLHAPPTHSSHPWYLFLSCSKTVPSFFINSHVDMCLVGGQPSKPASASAGPTTASGIRQAAATAAAAGPFQPLSVPPKLVPSLTTEKVCMGTKAVCCLDI